MWLEAGKCWPGLLEYHGIPPLFLYFFHRLVFPRRYLIGGTIPTSLLVLVKNIFAPLYCIWLASCFVIPAVFSWTWSYTGCCWNTLVQVNGSADWEVRVKGDLTPRSDNGRINSSPTTAVPPVLTLRHGATHTITIPGKVSSIHICVIYTYLCHSQSPCLYTNVIQ